METKAQIARKMYGESLKNLSGGQKAAVTKAYNKQTDSVAPTKAKGAIKSISVSQVEVVFTRVGGRSGKVLVDIGTTYGEAIALAKNFKFNADKEGLQDMKGNVVSLTDSVKTGNIIVSPNVDSAC